MTKEESVLKQVKELLDSIHNGSIDVEYLFEFIAMAEYQYDKIGEHNKNLLMEGKNETYL